MLWGDFKQGNANEYYEIIEKLSSTGTSPQLESWLVALSDCASEVSKSHEKLVAASLVRILQEYNSQVY